MGTLLPSAWRLILPTQTLFNDNQVAKDIPILPMATIFVLRMRYIGIQIDKDTFMNQIFYTSHISQYPTINDFKAAIGNIFSDYMIEQECCNIYELYHRGKIFDFGEDEFRIFDNWWPAKRSLIFQLKTRDNQLWYAQHYESRHTLLMSGYCRIIQRNTGIFIPIDIQNLCKKYYRRSLNNRKFV